MRDSLIGGIVILSVKRCLFCLIVVGALRNSVAFSGGPLIVDPSGSGAYRWDPNKPLRYKVDRGGLNSSLDEQQSIDLVGSVFKKWEDLPSASITFQYDGLLDVDVTKDNVNSFLKQTSDGIAPIILDRDGGITDLLLGAGASRNVLGFAGPTKFDTNTKTFLQGDAVINGSAGVGTSTLRAVMLHEFGHLQGLDHTQAGIEFTGLVRGNFVPGARKFIPIMFPIIYSGAPEDPQDDDILWLSYLYPVDSTGIGTISGVVKRASGEFFPGANVVLRAADYAPGAGKVRIYSVVSDFLMKNTGEFKFQGVKPGDYHLFIEPLHPSFTEGSSVGPFDSRFTSFPLDFYNGDGESGDPDTDDPTVNSIITVAADGKVQDIVMISNEIPNNLTTMADDDSVAYVFPNGFKFPFYGKTYDRVFVNSDGNLTLGRVDIASTERDLKRFVADAPRIGALFSDLDPSKGGEILFTQRDNSVTFTWLNVPEFSDKKTLDASDGNQFSVTLFSNGDVEMKYGNLKVTRGDQEALVAVVGVTKGGGATAQEVDLSKSASFTYGNTNGIVEVFTDSIDLAGKTILFRSASTDALTQQKTLIYPFSQQTSEFYMGIAVSNSGGTSAKLDFTGYDKTGKEVYSNHSTIAPTSQIAKLLNELFVVSGSEVPSGWIQLKADSSAISSFYQVGSDRWLDGATAFSEITTHLYLTRVFDGAATFQGKDAKSYISIVNPNDILVRIVLSLYSPAGTKLSTQEMKLASHALIYDQLSNLFTDASFPRGEGYISVQAIGGGIAVFELVRTSDAAIGLSGIAPSLSNKFYSAQLAHGIVGTESFFTSLNLVNTTGVTVSVKAQAYNEKHETIGVPYSKKLAAYGSAQVDAKDLFGLGDARTTSPAYIGSIELTADSAGFVGDVLFGDATSNVRFAADLPLQSELATEAVFSHVANGTVNPADSSSDYFTGIALYNPNTVSASVTLEVYTKQGQVRRSDTIVLEAGRRSSKLLSEFVPSAGSQIGGYIVLKSDVGIVAQELFGNVFLDFLSAVPPDVFKKADLK